jgi:hypothetical protein
MLRPYGSDVFILAPGDLQVADQVMPDSGAGRWFRAANEGVPT